MTATETDLAAHTPVAWYWEAGGDQCPHGAEPDRSSDAWDIWAEHHQSSPRGVFVCLDAPAGDMCEACSDEFGDAVSMSACRARAHARPEPNATKPEPGDHQPVTVWVGTFECLDRECGEYYTADGDDRPEVERCSHVGAEVICGGCSILIAHDYYKPAVPWPCQHATP